MFKVGRIVVVFFCGFWVLNFWDYFVVVGGVGMVWMGDLVVVGWLWFGEFDLGCC